MNAQHSCKTDQWGTPCWVIGAARVVLGGIELDPCSSAEFNKRVGAQRWLTDSLDTPWVARSVFVNPPGGKVRNRSKTALFWAKLMEERERGAFGHALWVGFSIEQLAVTQKYHPTAMASFPFCVPRGRLAFVSADGEEGGQPSHANVIVYVPGYINHAQVFQTVFSNAGFVRL